MSQPWMPLYIADYMADTGHLGAAESGAYLHLIMHYWRQGSIPSEDRLLARIAKMTDREWSKAKSVILAFFDPDLKHARIEKELEKAAQKREARALAGSRGGNAKSLNNKKSNLANATILPEQKPTVVLASSSQPQEIDKSISNKPSASPRQILSECLSEATACDVIAHRKAKRSPLTAGAASGLVKAFREFGDCEAAAREMILRGWTGFKPEWMREATRAGPFTAKPKITSLTRLAMGFDDENEPNSANADYGFSPPAASAEPGYFGYSSDHEHEHGAVERREALADSGIEIIPPRRSVGS